MPKPKYKREEIINTARELTRERGIYMKKVRSYVITAYACFWAMVLVLCGGASMVFHAPPPVMRLLSNLCAWSPTFVLLAKFKTLLPGLTVKEFYKNAFGGRIKLSLCLLIIIVIPGAVILSALASRLIGGNGLAIDFGGYPIWLSAVLSLTSGPLGEEAGWRGYLRPALEEKYTFPRACVYQGLIWAFWHAVLWAVDCDFSGLMLIPYIISNVVVMTSLAVIMSVILRRYNNLFYAIFIHFCFNFTYCLLSVDIEFYIAFTVIFAAIVAVFYAADRRLPGN